MLRIPINQLYSENVKWGCLDDCDSSNEDKLQAIVDYVCNTTDWKQVDLRCLSTTRKDNPIDILNLITAKICSTNQSINGVQIDLSKIVLCGKDNTGFIFKECLEIQNDCFPTITLEAILQAIIKRINSYSYLISQLKLQIDDLSTKYNAQQSQINTLITRLNGCCP